MRKVKIVKLIMLSVIFSFGVTGQALAENRVFPDFEIRITRLEFGLELFDLKVNHLNILSSPSFKYLSTISSAAYVNDKIYCWIKVHPFIMNGSVEERKNRIDKLCNDLFIEYQKRFLMVDQDYKKKPRDLGIPALRMNSCNLKIWLDTYATDIPSKSLAEWECGTMKYKEDFFKN